MAWLPDDRYEAELEAETARLGAAVSGLEPATPVPTCPEWTVRDLVTHVGTGQRWATGIIEANLQTPHPYATVPAPHDPSAWTDWLAEGARSLAAAVRDGGPERRVWTWRPDDRTAGFWLRKMLHDEVIHRFDAEIAGGHPGDLAPDLAADGVSDLLASIATLSPTDSLDPIFAGLAGTGETMLLRATDADPTTGTWMVERSPAGVHWRHGRAPADVTVRAPARELLLVLNRRLDADRQDVEITGDRAVFIHWLEHSRF
ncbi:MAG TPA: maleylpyruvate isomerase family mycothiol-dependent enzyme [Micromonosporaceae bacterium]|nr:maleylpyruvate isomerase family mycothiol-dependent enzyme [Micromonosporaceae bacterium]